MKDINTIFDESLQSLIQLVEKSSYVNCLNTCSDLTRISTLSDYDDGIMIGEILESSFFNIGPLMQEYDIDEKDRKLLKDQLQEKISLISKLYKENDKGKMYDALKQLRVIVTKFQFKCWNMLERKNSPGTRRFVREVP